jgi:hypothetical protein
MKREKRQCLRKYCLIEILNFSRIKFDSETLKYFTDHVGRSMLFPSEPSQGLIASSCRILNTPRWLFACAKWNALVSYYLSVFLFHQIRSRRHSPKFPQSSQAYIRNLSSCYMWDLLLELFDDAVSHIPQKSDGEITFPINLVRCAQLIRRSIKSFSSSGHFSPYIMP